MKSICVICGEDCNRDGSLGTVRLGKNPASFCHPCYRKSIETKRDQRTKRMKSISDDLSMKCEKVRREYMSEKKKLVEVKKDLSKLSEERDALRKWFKSMPMRVIKAIWGAS